MPKFYRYRETSPTRKSSRSKSLNERPNEICSKDAKDAKGKDKKQNDVDLADCWFDTTATPVAAWFARRIYWRTPDFMPLMRHSFVHLSHRTTWLSIKL